MLSRIHIVLQGKGGVGKSLVASMIAQWLVSKGCPPLCIDTDPVNQTFAGYKSLEARHVELFDSQRNIDHQRFDTLVEILSDHPAQAAVIDNGAATFVPLCSYIIENDLLNFLSTPERSVLIHSVLTGGQSEQDTNDGVLDLMENFEHQQFCLWINPFFGTPKKDYLLEYQNHAQVSHIINVPQWRRETFGRDLEKILSTQRTFDEALADRGLSVMSRSRLMRMRDDFFSLLSVLDDTKENEDDEDDEDDED